MLYYFDATLLPPVLSPMEEVAFSETSDISLLSAIGKIPAREATRRLANDHKAFVAFYKDIPAAYGWMAMGKARVGELAHEFVLPIGHRYLWNFRTLEPFRGMGLYPRLLQHIVAAESDHSICFWIMHAPENKASRSGIMKAGFTLAGRVSLLRSSIIFGPNEAVRNFGELPDEIGFNRSGLEHAKCWKCSSPYMKNQTPGCCCEAKHEDCNGKLFMNSHRS